MTPLRSWLFVPATRPDRVEKAIRSGADALIVDLEDAVAPPDKAEARRRILANWPQPAGGPQIALRINPLESLFGLEDVAALLSSAAMPDFIVLPKCDTAEHLRLLDRLLSDANKRSRLIALVESAAGLADVDAIARATPRLVGTMLGAADLASDIGAVVAWEPMLHARGRLVAACALAGVLPIDTPFFDIANDAGLAEETDRAVAMGFGAKAAIHPSQVGAINAALTPDAASIGEARLILDEAAKGIGVVRGKMVDEAMARRARRILQRAGIAR